MIRSFKHEIQKIIRTVFPANTSPTSSLRDCNASKIQSVQNVFNAETEVAHYARLIEHGLLETEKYVIKKYFKSSGNILDLGCGAGREAFAMAAMGFQVTGIDIAPNMVQYANDFAKTHQINSVEFIAADISKLSIPANSYSYIILPTQTLEHIHGRVHRIALLKKCKRWLKKEGVLFFSTHERKHGLKFWWYWTNKEFAAKITKNREELGDTWLDSNNPETKMKEKMFLHFYTKKEAIADLISAGLQLKEIVKSTDYETKLWEGRSMKYVFVCRPE